MRLRPERPNDVWSYDFVEARTHDGRKKIRMLNVIDEFTRECMMIRVARKLRVADVIDVLPNLFILRGVLSHIRSDNGSEFIAKAFQTWPTAVGAKTVHIAPGLTWENGHIESCNAKLRDELLNGEIVYTLKEARTVIKRWRKHGNTIRPHSSLGYVPPAPEVGLCPAALTRPAPPATPVLALRPTMHQPPSRTTDWVLASRGLHGASRSGFSTLLESWPSRSPTGAEPLRDAVAAVASSRGSFFGFA